MMISKGNVLCNIADKIVPLQVRNSNPKRTEPGGGR
jgi:hypothetical protein